MTVATSRGGKLKKSITLYTNIPENDGIIRLTIQGEIRQPVDVEPHSAWFGRLTPDAARSDSLERKLMIVSNMESDAKLSDVRSTNPAFHAQTRVIEPGKKYELTVSVVSPLQDGNNGGKVVLSTGIKEMPTLSVPVSAYVMSDVDVNPNKLRLPAQRANDLKRQFIVRNNTKQPLKISDLEASDPALAVALEEMAPGTIFKITVDVPPAYHGRPGGDKITFKTDCATAPVITIPITEFNYPGRANADMAHRTTRAHLPLGEHKQAQLPSSTNGAESDTQKKPATGTVKPKESKPTGD